MKFFLSSTFCNPIWLFLSLMFDVENTLEMSLDLTPLFKTLFVDARVKSLVLNVDYLENQHNNFTREKYGRKRCLPHTHISFSGLWFFFLHGLFTPLITIKLKKIIRLSPCSLNSCYSFFIFWFIGLSFKTQFKIEFWPLVNGGQLELE